MTTVGSLICSACIHKLAYGCEAFPEGIPVVEVAKTEHREPLVGDHGIQFELDPDKQEEYSRYIAERGGLGMKGAGGKVSFAHFDDMETAEDLDEFVAGLGLHFDRDGILRNKDGKEIQIILRE